MWLEKVKGNDNKSGTRMKTEKWLKVNDKAYGNNDKEHVPRIKTKP